MNHLIDALFTQGYYVWDDFLSSNEVEQLRQCLPPEWEKARIGRGKQTVRASSIRSDKVHWLHRTMDDPVLSYLDRMEALRLEANRHFFLGLFEYEAHFAKYEPGDYYQKHLDSFKGNENRKLTTVLYMNDSWTVHDAGELAIYDLEDKHLVTIAPKSGRLLVFFSEQFPHEVLPTNSERYSIAGWFRVNGVQSHLLDIAS